MQKASELNPINFNKKQRSLEKQNFLVRKWVGVKGPKSSGSDERGERGGELKIGAICVSKVFKI